MVSVDKLSADAKAMLRHFKDKKLGQRAYEYPDTLAGLFDDPERSEVAQEELAGAGLLDLAPGAPDHVPQRHRVRSAGLTLDGERFISKNKLD